MIVLLEELWKLVSFFKRPSFSYLLPFWSRTSWSCFSRKCLRYSFSLAIRYFPLQLALRNVVREAGLSIFVTLMIMMILCSSHDYDDSLRFLRLFVISTIFAISMIFAIPMFWQYLSWAPLLNVQLAYSNLDYNIHHWYPCCSYCGGIYGAMDLSSEAI